MARTGPMWPVLSCQGPELAPDSCTNRVFGSGGRTRTCDQAGSSETGQFEHGSPARARPAGTIWHKLTARPVAVCRAVRSLAQRIRRRAVPARADPARIAPGRPGRSRPRATVAGALAVDSAGPGRQRSLTALRRVSRRPGPARPGRRRHRRAPARSRPARPGACQAHSAARQVDVDQAGGTVSAT